MDARDPGALIEVEGGAGHLDRIRAFLEAFSEREKLEAEAAFALDVCVEELVTNVFAHGARPGTQPRVAVHLERRAGVLRARIEDNCPPYNPLRREEVDVHAPLEERPVGGLGIHLVKRLMHAVTYEFAGGRNIIVLERLLELPVQSAETQARFNLDADEAGAPGALVVRLRGRVDGTVAPLFDARLTALLAREPALVVVDASALDYISSAGLGVFVAAARNLNTRGARLALAGLRRPVRNVFELAGFATFASLHPDVSAALRG